MRLIHYGKGELSAPINARLKQHYTAYIFQIRAKLDLPTSEDPAISRQLEDASPHNTTAFETLAMVYGLFTTLLQLISMVSVLASVLRNQQDGPLLALLTFLQSVFDWIHQMNTYRQPVGKTHRPLCTQSTS